MTCRWPVETPDCKALDRLSPDARYMYVQMATEFLMSWTGYGECTVTLRPCRQACDPSVVGSTFFGRGRIGGPLLGNRSPWTPALIGGRWFNLTCCECGPGFCGCKASHGLELPGPVSEVIEILIDGHVLPQTAYRVDDASRLVRLDGKGWPSTQNLDLPATEVGTWQVTYYRGTPVPKGGRIAAGVLANELAKAACNDNTCQLPQRVQTVTRQGVTVGILDSFDGLERGQTGIWLIDSWVASVTRPRVAGGSVLSPDVPRGGPFASAGVVTTSTAPVPVYETPTTNPDSAPIYDAQPTGTDVPTTYDGGTP